MLNDIRKDLLTKIARKIRCYDSVLEVNTSLWKKKHLFNK